MQFKPTKTWRLLLAIAVVCVVGGMAAGPSFASGPALKLYPSMPGFIEAGQGVFLFAGVQNVGTANTDSPITFSATLAPGLESPEPALTKILVGRVSSSDVFPEVGEASCATLGLTVTCTVPWTLAPGAQIKLAVPTAAEADASGALVNSFSVSGGGSSGTVTAEQTMTVGSPGEFKFSEAAASLDASNGSQVTQAGSDPSAFTTHLHFTSFDDPRSAGGRGVATPIGLFKDVAVDLPVGFTGDPQAAPLCTPAQLALSIPETSGCPADSQVGVVHIFLNNNSLFVGLFNVQPPPGYASELGFNVLGVIVGIDASLRSADNGITVVSHDTSTSIPITAVDVEVWGVPADSSHDDERGTCLESGGLIGANGFSCPLAVAHNTSTTSTSRTAFLRMPTSCSGKPLEFAARANSYQHTEQTFEADFTSPTVTGCDLLPFSPGISVFPTSTAANSPTGLSVRLSLPQNTNPDGLAEADLKKAVVTLPEGMAINPSAADGLQACTDAQLRVGESGPAQCPEASKVGTVLLHTPLLANPVEGNVYVLTQQSSDPESGQMFRIGMELRDDVHGIDIKVPGTISLNKSTGRLTTTFDNNPQLPFSDITLSFKAGARAPLVTPASCQTQTTEADLYSWAQPDVAVHRSSSFTLTSGADGTPCPSPAPFNPVLEAGVSSVQAGGYTPFLATFKRSDADQSMQRVSVKMPQGLLGSLIGLPLCPEAQASAGTCSQASEIGSVMAGAGAGPTPFYVTGGKVFMTGPYEGAPFGLSVVVPAKAGPFDLGTVVVRAKVEVDPHTAQLTVTTDPLPQVVSGVPVNLRLVNVTINRPNFTYNPTSCNPTSVSGTMTGGQGATASLSNRFQVTNCGALGFKPKFTVSTSGKTSRANGASLDAKLSYPKNLGQANIARVKVSLPKQLPSRLTTLQKACTAQTFESNPAACPSASRIGTARATTPVLPVPLVGPVYFVSHGGEAFPDLVVVLQGYGVTVDLVGSTFISKAGITSTTFKTVPDVPVGTFELKLPKGKFSALAANGNLCNSKLTMPTAFVAQDGAEVHQSTSIATTGCAKHKAKKANGKARKRKRGNDKK